MAATIYDIDAIHTGVGDLADWIAQHHNVAVGRRSGADTAIECPIHRPGHTTSATVHRWPNGRQTFKCWRCDIGPVDIIDLTIETGNAHNRAEAIRLLAEQTGAPTTTTGGSFRRAPTRRIRKVITQIDLDPNEIDDTQAGWNRVLAYCHWRGWNEQTADYFGLQAVRRFDGWRIRHPFLNHRGETVAAQDYKPNSNQRWISAKGSTLTLFGQQNLHHIDNNLSIVDVTEGVSDCITISTVFGYSHAVVGAPGASSWTEQHSDALSTCQIIVWPDNDTAGTGFAERITQIHRSIPGLTLPVAIGRIPDQYSDLTDWYRNNPDSFAGDFNVARHTAWKTQQ